MFSWKMRRLTSCRRCCSIKNYERTPFPRLLLFMRKKSFRSPESFRLYFQPNIYTFRTQRSFCFCQYTGMLKNSLSKIPRTSHIWALGDFNLPHMDWETEQITQNCPCRSVYESFVDTIHDFGLEQVVKDPTRGKNILDLFLLSQPSLVNSTKLIPPLGTGDHNIVYHELKINLGRRQQKQRPIKLYKKTDWSGFREEMGNYQKSFHDHVSGSDTNTKWVEFKKALNKLTEKFIPTKFCKPKDSHPWVTREIKRLMNKRDRLYAKIKQNRSNPNLKTKF